SAQTTLTTLRSRLRPNSTVPAVSANSVSSFPRPTPSPGWTLVPRWRTRISPARTDWPPKRLTPRRWALESRPFLEELTPFFDAIWNQSLSSRRDRSGDARDLQPGQLLAVALALASSFWAEVTLSPSTSSTGARSTLSPASPATRLITMVSPTDTFS